MAITGGIQQANKDFRKTSAGVKLGRALFDPRTQAGLTSTQIVSLLRQAGIPIPVGGVVTSDIAQIIMAGGAVSNSISVGASIQSFISPSVNILNATMDILQTTGLLKLDGPAAVSVKLLTDEAMIVSSGGLNIYADIMYVFDFIMGIFSMFQSPPDMTAQVRAYAASRASQNLNNWFRTRENQQRNALAVQFQDYQNGKTSVFTMISNVAAQSPDLFDTYFPEIGAFIPTVTLTHSETFKIMTGGERSSLSTQYVNTQGLIANGLILASDTETMNFSSILNTKDIVQNAILEAFVLGPLSIYDTLDQVIKIEQNQVKDASLQSPIFFPPQKFDNGVRWHPSPVRRIPFWKLAVLGMFPPYLDKLVDGFNILPVLQSLNLTPSDLDEGDVFNYELTRGDLSPNAYMAPHPGVAINGVDFDTPQVRAEKQLEADTSSHLQVLLNYDHQGQIYPLLKNPICKKIIAEWGMIPALPTAQVHLNPVYQRQDPVIYRTLSNFWNAVGLLDVILKDPSFIQDADKIKQQPDVAQVVTMKENIDAMHRKLQFLSVGRNMNALARTNVSSFFGQKPGTVKFQPMRPGQLASISVN